MHFKRAKSKELRAKTFTPHPSLPPRWGGMGGEALHSVFSIILSVTFLLLFSLCPLLSAEIRDRVVAFVDNTAITLSELEETYARTVKVSPDIKKNDVLNTMVNRLLLIKEAKKIKLEATSEDELMKEYIDIKIRAFIRIKEEDLTEFYKKHLTDFQDKEFESVRDEIENYLTEKELNERLKLHINELREKSCIKIQLNAPK